MSTLCPHLYTIDKSFSKKLLEELEDASNCHWCGQIGVNQWLCLYAGCLKIGCGDEEPNHAAVHINEFPSHCISINLLTNDVWCDMCEIEVTPWVESFLECNRDHLGGPINTSDVTVAQPVTPHESDQEEEEEVSGNEEEEKEFVGHYIMNDAAKPRGLVGLSNLGLTCYMNAALQALSNSMPLAQYMTDFFLTVRTDSKQPGFPGLSRVFQRLMKEMWDPKQPSYVTPSHLYQMFKQLNPSFRSYTQQDSQEFLRYLMDQIHEELRESVIVSQHESDENGENEGKETSTEYSADSDSDVDKDQSLSGISDLSEDDYETCDSGVSDTSNHLHRKRKRHHSHQDQLWQKTKGLTIDHEGSEFSDAISDASLLKSSLTGGRNLSSMTSGLGSSKPSIASFGSNYRGSQVGNRGKSHVSNVAKRKKSIQYRSIISDIFDGTLVSSVQCLTCNTVSSRKETFQDLSLPIPSFEQLSRLQHSHLHHQHQTQVSSSLHLAKAPCDAATDGWMWWLWSWLRSWFWGPTVSLHHCLAAFFSADELKGDNMYSCEKCGKLRNGIKYSKMIQLPEVLIIHLKRFRHEYMFSSKIGNYVSFPLHGLDLSPFLHKDCSSQTLLYDLYAVICHHGSVGGGHYTCYAQNWSNGQWYEFDDQCVTEVSPATVENCEAYVLFYKKSSPEMISRRVRTIKLMKSSSREPSLMQFYISKQWINKFNTFSEPGPIDNSDFLCPHGGVQPQKSSNVGDLVVLFSQEVWEYLHEAFGGGPPCTQLYECVTCKQELEALFYRRRTELTTFANLHKKFQNETQVNIIYAISMRWYRQWQTFVRAFQDEAPPPAIDNLSICTNKSGQPALKYGSDFAPISEEIWNFFHDIYGGGPEIYIRYGNASKRLDNVEEVPNSDVRQEDFNSPERSSRKRTVSANETQTNHTTNSPNIRKSHRFNSCSEDYSRQNRGNTKKNDHFDDIQKIPSSYDDDNGDISDENGDLSTQNDRL